MPLLFERRRIGHVLPFYGGGGRGGDWREKLLTGGDWSSWGFSEDFCVLSVKHVNIRKYVIVEEKRINDHCLVTILVPKDNSFDF